MTLALQIPADHPAFAGHFPGNPLLPGVVLLDVAVRTAGGPCAAEAVWEIVSAKFHNIVRPGDCLSVEHEPQPNQTLRFTIRRADDVVASGVLRPLCHKSADNGQ